MASSVVLSEPITAEQITEFLELQAIALRTSGLPNELTQQVLRYLGVALAEEFVATVRQRVEAINNIIRYHVQLNPRLSLKEMFDATGREQYIDYEVAKSAPFDEANEAGVCFFPVGGYINDDGVMEDYRMRGLRPAGLNSLCQVNIDDQTFADQHPNGTHWKDSQGCWCSATFRHHNGARRLCINRRGFIWLKGDWLAGVPT